MNRSTIRSFVRRALMEDVADNWTDAELNTIINAAAQSWQDYILAVDDTALLEWHYASLVEGQRYYAKPAGMRQEVELGYLEDGGEYQPMSVTSFGAIRRGWNKGSSSRNSDVDLNADGTVTYEYAHAGAWFYLDWKPSTALVDGLECAYVPDISLGSDTESPAIALGLHYGIVAEAVIMAKGETEEDDSRWVRERQIMVSKIPHFYRKTSAGPEVVHPDVRKAAY